MSCCYMQNDLREKIECLLKFHLISSKTIFQIYSVAAKHNCEALLEKCFR